MPALERKIKNLLPFVMPAKLLNTRSKVCISTKTETLVD